MNTFASNRSLFRLTLSCLILASFLLAYTPAGHAQASLDKHARKVHNKLQKYRPGSYLHLVLHNSTNEYGALGALSDGSFSFKSSDTNAVSAISYSEVASIKTDREPIGEGSEHHYFRTRTYVIAGAVIAGAAVAAVVVR